MVTDGDAWAGREVLYDPGVSLLGRALRLRFDVRVGGQALPAAGGVLVAANHVHHLDAVVLADAALRHGRRLRFLALADLWDLPVVGWALRRGRMIPVHRGAGAARMVEDACRALQAGQAVLVYPEGHLPRDERPWPARPGAGLLAIAADAAGIPVVPMAVWGLGPERLRRRLRPPVAVVVGPPVDLSLWADQTDPLTGADTAEAVMGAVRALLPDAEEIARQPARRRRRRRR